MPKPAIAKIRSGSWNITHPFRHSTLGVGSHLHRAPLSVTPTGSDVPRLSDGRPRDGKQLPVGQAEVPLGGVIHQRTDLREHHRQLVADLGSRLRHRCRVWLGTTAGPTFEDDPSRAPLVPPGGVVGGNDSQLVAPIGRVVATLSARRQLHPGSRRRHRIDGSGSEATHHRVRVPEVRRAHERGRRFHRGIRECRVHAGLTP